jgi:hypothetical protein
MNQSTKQPLLVPNSGVLRSRPWFPDRKTNANLFVQGGPPCGLALDTRGNLYIGHAGNNRICKVDSNGIITTVAGNGDGGVSVDSGAATNASIGL